MAWCATIDTSFDSARGTRGATSASDTLRLIWRAGLAMGFTRHYCQPEDGSGSNSRDVWRMFAAQPQRRDRLVDRRPAIASSISFQAHGRERLQFRTAETACPRHTPHGRMASAVRAATSRKCTNGGNHGQFHQCRPIAGIGIRGSFHPRACPLVSSPDTPFPAPRLTQPNDTSSITAGQRGP